eukprot:gene5556-8927_t
MNKLFVSLAVFAAVVSAVYSQAGFCAPPCNPCTPAIDNRTVIEAVPGFRATAEIIADYGNCSVTYTGYQWQVSWGDGVVSYKNLTHLQPQQAIHTYQAKGTYTVVASYCAVPHYCCESCSSISKTLEIKY